MIQKKICMLGSFAVGKTSLVGRYVHSAFSDKYLTTIGVKIDRKEVVVDDVPVNLVLWDIHGEDEFQKVRSSYLRGASGYFLIADGTRPETLRTVFELHELADSTVGNRPFLVLLNKADLESEWKLEESHIRSLTERGWAVHKTSAKTGDHVLEAFDELARKVLSADSPPPLS